MKNGNPILLEFVREELFSEGVKCSILNFVLNVNIRAGEYEGNKFVIKKLDTGMIVLFREFIYPDAEIERDRYMMLTVDEFISSVSAITGQSPAELREQGDFFPD